jgi:hypothetical protein
MKKMNFIIILALILIALGSVGAILLTIGQIISSSKDKTDIINTTKEQNKMLTDELRDIKQEGNKLADTLGARDERIRIQNEKIQSLNNRLAEKQDFIQDYLTGGKSYPLIDFNWAGKEVINNAETTTFEVFLTNQGRFAIPSLQTLYVRENNCQDDLGNRNFSTRFLCRPTA